MFYLEHDLTVREGDVINGSIAVRKSNSNFRELDIKVSYHTNTEQAKRDFVNLYKLRWSYTLPAHYLKWCASIGRV